MWLFFTTLAEFTNKLCITKGQGERMPLIHAFLFGGNHSGSRAPCKETPATEQLERAKDRVSHHPELKQGTSNKTELLRSVTIYSIIKMLISTLCIIDNILDYISVIKLRITPRAKQT